MINSTTQANVRSGPKSLAGLLGHAGSMLMALPVTLVPAAASASVSITLPSGAIPLGFQHDGGATGGTNPTFDMGTAASSAIFINEGVADAAGFVGVNGTGANVALTTATTIYAGVGASAATGGSITGMFLYVMTDDTIGLNE